MRTEDRTEEQILVMRAQRGDADAFRVLVERYQKQTYTLALRMVHQPDDAEDIAQEAFLSAWKALPRFRMDASFSTWLYRLTVNAAVDLLRRRERDPGSCSTEDPAAVRLTDPSPTPEEQVQQKERQKLIWQAVATLTENHRKILLLREIGGLDYREIGEALELTPGTVKSRLARARRELREKLLEGNYFSKLPSNQQEGDEDVGKL